MKGPLVGDVALQVSANAESSQEYRGSREFEDLAAFAEECTMYH